MQHIQNLIEGFQSLQQQYVYTRIATDTMRFENLFSGFRAVQKVGFQLEKQIASQYNIFEVLNIRHLETKTHTPFLYDLLNVHGGHSQGVLFYERFIEMVFIENSAIVKSFIPNNYNLWRVIEEQYIGKINGERGFIDIFIENKSVHQPFAIIIENKIYAGDQPKQIEKYYEYALSKGYSKEQILVIYLTPSGTLPNTNSLSKIKKNELEKLHLFYPISYKKDIYQWLFEVSKMISAPNFKTVLNQYLSIIEKL
jgi:hypothetical protein